MPIGFIIIYITVSTNSTGENEIVMNFFFIIKLIILLKIIYFTVYDNKTAVNSNESDQSKTSVLSVYPYVRVCKMSDRPGFSVSPVKILLVSTDKFQRAA